MPDPDEPDLTPDEERFVEEYLIDLNGTAAYLRVRPGAKRWTAAVQASRLLKKPNVAAAVKAGRADLARRCKVTAEKVIRELAAVAFHDPGAAADLTSDELRLLAPRHIPLDVRKAIAGMKSKRRTVTRDDSTEETEEREYRFLNRLDALDKLARHLGLLRDLPALEVLLAALPPDVAATVRAALAAGVHPGGSGGRGAGADDADAGAPGGGPDPADEAGGALA